MKFITTTTETMIKKMVASESRFHRELNDLLDAMKSRIGCYGATIKEMKKWGIRIDNRNQFKPYITNGIRGLGAVYQDLVIVAETHDLEHVTVRDFNKLVKLIYNQSKEN